MPIARERERLDELNAVGQLCDEEYEEAIERLDECAKDYTDDGAVEAVAEPPTRDEMRPVQVAVLIAIVVIVVVIGVMIYGLVTSL